MLVANRVPDWQHEDVGASEQGNGGDTAQSSLRGKLGRVFRGLATAGDCEVAGAVVVGARAEAAGGQASRDPGMSVSWKYSVRGRVMRIWTSNAKASQTSVC